MANKQQIVALLRKQYGSRSGLRYNRRAPTQKERENAIQRCREITERRAEVRRQLRESHQLDKLVEACRFVLDTEGDKTAVDTLRAPAESMETYLDLRAENAELVAEERKISGMRHSYRYDAYTDGGFARTILASADTLDDLFQKLKAK